MWLQVGRRCRVRKLDSVGEVGNYIFKLTEQISMKPHKPPPAFANFCAEAAGGRTRAARTVGEGFRQVLLRISGVSDRIADGILTKFTTLNALLSSYDVLSPAEGAALLAKIECPGEKAARRVGPALSKLIYTIFTTTDGTLLIKSI